ncbi:MAG: hypothetical protein A2Z64_09000 [Betaproteobacteria bacterium RIFCSPLOWO2_02_67_12]|nr:MAG: hypothetical protein A2Z64_09000 [Betaproteobacteria bacterium RIFCSPLOWO2_02_67_12]OGA28938.1 MAG: hypothetical protein A3I65_07745 [Betaproteobacteria bacterium RIFCSPLOWO2_02_FULL_68_150]OGA65262.1 MAG: hypothetical protein A3F77_12110 [Betaproteobacteria bacterium RIFCSPLOWO2_12_FULL_67_28]
MSTSNATQLVLVVDDDSITRVLARETLEQGGFAVEEANDGLAGLSAFERLRPDIVLLDVMMPVLDGYGACKALRVLEAGAHIPVLMMTGLDDSASINRAFEVGATDFITKPIAWPMLVHRVRYLLRASRAFLDLAQSRARLTNAQRIAKLGHWEWNLATGEIQCSDEIYRMTGRTREQLPASRESLLQLLHADDRPVVDEALDTALQRRERFNADFRVMRPDDSIRVVHAQGEVQCDGFGVPARIEGTAQDITERKRVEERIHQLALYDSLTGLPNRSLFKEQLGRAIARAERGGGVLAVLSLDLDRFQRINDTLGYEAGDLLLQETANRLARTLRQTDFVALSDRNEANYFVARQGGNEFSVLLDGVHRAQDTANVARRILEALARPFDLDGNEIVASACIGIAVYPLDGKDADSLRKGAGSAMHHAKQQGRNGYQYYNAVMNTRALEKLALESHLRKALERDEFALHYQPKVDLENGNIAGAEALLRWISPERGLVPPAQFIPMLEEAGMIVEVGAWALRKAVADHLRWHDQGLPAPRVSVNVSAIQLRQEDFVAVLAHAIKDGAARPGIDLEITESLVMHDIESNIAKLKAVRDLGMDIAIDDFGTGHSSLAYLAKLPLQTLKIDRSFIITMLDNADAATLVRTIISLAHSLRLIVVAEGVETEEQAKMLRLLRCDQMQGYLFSKPLPFEEMTALLKAAAPGERAQGKVNPERARLREAP